MKDKKTSRRRSLRLGGYDYTQPGAYFVTICSYQRRSIFGELDEDHVVLTEAGQVAADEWFRTAQLRPEVKLSRDEFIVMPNHIHGVIHLDWSRVGARRRRAPASERFGQPVSGSLATIIRAYKSAVTRNVNRMNNCFGCRIWQRNFYEHVIRTEAELDRLRRYIIQNPSRRPLDLYTTWP
jgi:REP element-mobilizing transposase RayT